MLTTPHTTVFPEFLSGFNQSFQPAVFPVIAACCLGDEHFGFGLTRAELLRSDVQPPAVIIEFLVF